MRGLVSNIQRFSVNDGYGIRTIIFLMGCTLRCAWCQNPETLSGKPEIMYVEDLCSGCRACIDVCSVGAISWENGKIETNREKCKNCFKCVDACCFDARQPSGRVMTVDEVFNDFMKDLVFYQNSGGGLTLSGGEPLFQVDFSAELLKRTSDVKLHTAIETAGNVPYESFEKVLPYTNLFLYDLKAFDDEKHQKWTKASNKIILKNLERLSKTGKEIIVRVPLIPEVNDGDEFHKIVNYVTSMPAIKEIHILSYHSLGSSKYSQLNMVNTMNGYREENDYQVKECKTYAEKMGLRVSIGGAGF